MAPHPLVEPPEIVPLQGWVPVEPFPALADSQSFVSGNPGEGRLRVAYFSREGDEDWSRRSGLAAGQKGLPATRMAEAWPPPSTREWGRARGTAATRSWLPAHGRLPAGW